MSNTTSELGDKENQQWLDAIAGKPDASADPALNQQATVLRQALIKRNQEIINAIPEADPAGYERLLAELKRQGLLTDKPKTTFAQFVQGVFATFSALLKKGLDPLFRLVGGSGGAPIPAYWGVAATIVLGVGVVLQFGVFQGPSDSDNFATYRGDINVVTIFVDQPESRQREIVDSLRDIQAEVEISRLGYGRIQLKIRESDQVITILKAQGISPVISNGYITIDLVPKKKQ